MYQHTVVYCHVSQRWAVSCATYFRVLLPLKKDLMIAERAVRRSSPADSLLVVYIDNDWNAGKGPVFSKVRRSRLSSVDPLSWCIVEARLIQWHAEAAARGSG